MRLDGVRASCAHQDDLQRFDVPRSRPASGQFECKVNARSRMEEELFLSATVDSPRMDCGRGPNKAADCQRTRLMRRLRRDQWAGCLTAIAGLLRGTPSGNCSDTAPAIPGHDSDMARTLSRLALDNRRPVLRTRRGLCADTLLARTERGQGLFAAPDRSRPCPGDCRIKDADMPRSRTYAGRFAWTFRVPPRLSRGHKGLKGLRGWCLTKLNGFQFQKAA